jgi:hypothetical protein
MELIAAQRLFDLAAPFDELDIRRAYRRLVVEWHPDRFIGDEDLRNDAEERLKDINVARDRLLESLSPEPEPIRAAQPESRPRSFRKRQLDDDVDSQVGAFAGVVVAAVGVFFAVALFGPFIAEAITGNQHPLPALATKRVPEKVIPFEGQPRGNLPDLLFNWAPHFKPMNLDGSRLAGDPEAVKDAYRLAPTIVR